MIKQECSHFIDANNEKRRLTDEISKEIDGTIDNYANEALRTIAIAYRDLQPNQFGSKHDEPVNEDIKDVEK